MCLEALAYGDPIEPRHVDVEQHEVRLLGRHRVEGLVAVPRLAHVIAELDEVSFQELPVRPHVVDDQDDRHARLYEPWDSHPVTAPPARSRRWRGADRGGW